MTEKQIYYGENARWIIKERYFGKFNDTRTICTCHTLSDAKMIINAMVLMHKGRCFEYKAEKVADDYEEVCDAIFETDLFTGETINNEIYLNGISCL